MKTHNTKFLALIGIVLLVSCKSTEHEEDNPQIEKKESQNILDSTVNNVQPEKFHVAQDSDSLVKSKIDDTNIVVRKTGRSRAWNTLVDIRSINSSIYVDLKYATSDNFMNMVLYDTISKAYLQNDVAVRLGKCQEYLSRLNSGYHLLVYDGVRPVSVQWKMWRGLDSIPVKQRVKFVSNPANGSIHNYGAAVDLTICDANGKALDMGAGYDDIRKIAYPKLESHYLSTGELTKEQVANRKMLRKVMTSQNFRNISTEWWHFNACSRNTAKAKYVQLK